MRRRGIHAPSYAIPLGFPVALAERAAMPPASSQSPWFLALEQPRTIPKSKRSMTPALVVSARRWSPIACVRPAARARLSWIIRDASGQLRAAIRYWRVSIEGLSDASCLCSYSAARGGSAWRGQGLANRLMQHTLAGRACRLCPGLFDGRAVALHALGFCQCRAFWLSDAATLRGAPLSGLRATGG